MTTTRFQDLALAARHRTWDSDAAERRVRRWAGAEDGPTSAYRHAYVWYDAENAGNFTAYKLLIADVVGGDLHAVPRAVIAAAAVVQGARGPVAIPEAELGRVRAHLARYYEKWGEAPPWES